jgi:hypothetical protein
MTTEGSDEKEWKCSFCDGRRMASCIAWVCVQNN